MILLPVDPARPDAAALAPAAETLRRGGLVAFPTETVYGLGAHALDPAAVARIYAAKGRPGYNPLIVHVADADAARALSSAWPAEADALAAAFWPGPLTLVVPRHPSVPDSVTAGLPSVALRVPAHPVAHALLRAAGVPVAAPSANRSTEVSPTTAQHVARSLGERVDVIVDGGPCPVGIESTVLSLVGGVPTLLRPGTISVDDLRPVIGEVALPSAEPHATAARPSPGMMDRHYAPRAPLHLFNDPAEVRSDAGEKTVVLVMPDAPRPALPFGADVMEMPADPRTYASRLYSLLHELDERGYARVWVQPPPDAPAWAGVRDRLRRAASPHPLA
ncbi:L-threonylcarbamoyladenylate synthase [Longimicrobium sp.]|uniref:L-threonylcarbamoyladenylate synthase n=1 Tax=Longimicrobium sp. TaxID=2029185 RepID=UPI002E2EE84C|nr:L-threonylcarbamoyladenylate synthase [Longimicrobium sp.]HEX6039616.1 L-threonylcarbamoyladenylate synthase [Longimicrobium sp.]